MVFLRQTTLGRTCLHARPIWSDYSDPLRWSRGRSRQPSAALRAVYDGRAPVIGTRLKARLRTSSAPSDNSGCPPLSEGGRERGRCPHAAFWPTWTVLVPSFVQKLRGSPTSLPLDGLGCRPNPGCVSLSFLFASSRKTRLTCPTEPAPAEPETCGFRLFRLDCFSGSCSTSRCWATPRTRTQSVSRKLLLLASAHRLP